MVGVAQPSEKEKKAKRFDFMGKTINCMAFSIVVIPIDGITWDLVCLRDGFKGRIKATFIS